MAASMFKQYGLVVRERDDTQNLAQFSNNWTVVVHWLSQGLLCIKKGFKKLRQPELAGCLTTVPKVLLVFGSQSMYSFLPPLEHGC